MAVDDADRAAVFRREVPRGCCEVLTLLGCAGLVTDFFAIGFLVVDFFAVDFLVEGLAVTTFLAATFFIEAFLVALDVFRTVFTADFFVVDFLTGFLSAFVTFFAIILFKYEPDTDRQFRN